MLPQDDSQGILSGMPLPADSGAISINPDSVAIDGEAPQPGDTFIAQVEFQCVGVGLDGKLQCSVSKVNDEPVDGDDESQEPLPDDDDELPEDQGINVT